MTDPKEIADNLVALLQQIPELVASMNGDSSVIAAYPDVYPDHNLQQAIQQMPAPGILVVWQGTSVGTLVGNVWKHHFSIFFRVGEAAEDDAPSTARNYPALMALLINGIPTGSTLPMIAQDVHDGVDPMDPPTTVRQVAPEGLDYFEMNLTFTDKAA